jgi:D-alanyl-D-alanine carboxypeptidase
MDDEADGTSSTDSEESTDDTTTGNEVDCEALRLAIEDVITSYRTAQQLVGVVVSVDSGACDEWTAAWGEADIAGMVPLTSDHLMRAGSLTKSYTATLVLKLAEDGLLSLDDTLDAWGITVPSAGEITIRQLLNHTSGLADYQYNEDFDMAVNADPDRVWMPQELIDHAVALGPVGSPGEGYSYSNTNFIIAALVVEAAADQPYAAALRSRVLEPAQLEHTWVEGDETWTDAMATGYLTVAMGAPQDTTGFYHASQVWSAGAIVTTAEEQRTWIATLFTTDFLAPDSQMELVDFVPAPGTAGYGLGVFAVEFGNVVAYGHNGACMGFQAGSFYDPGTATSVAVMQNQVQLDAMGSVAADPTVLAGMILETVDSTTP